MNIFFSVNFAVEFIEAIYTAPVLIVATQKKEKMTVFFLTSKWLKGENQATLLIVF